MYDLFNDSVPSVKERYDDLPRVMEQVAEQELSRLPTEIESCSLIYFPEIGYLLAIPAWKEELTEQDLKLPNMNFKVSSHWVHVLRFFPQNRMNRENENDEQILNTKWLSYLKIGLCMFLLRGFCRAIVCGSSLSSVLNQWWFSLPQSSLLNLLQSVSLWFLYSSCSTWGVPILYRVYL